MGMLPDPARELREIAQRDQRRQLAEQAAARVTPEVAARIGQMFRWHPWLPSGVATGLARSGYDPLADETVGVSQQIVADTAKTPMGYAQPGDLLRPRSVSQAQKDAARAEMLANHAEGRGFFGAGEGGPMATGTRLPQGALKLPWSAARDALGDTWVSNEVVEPAARHTVTGENPVARGVRGAVRVGTSVLQTPQQMAQAAYRTQMENIRRNGVVGAADPRNLSHLGLGFAEQTDIGQMIGSAVPGGGDTAGKLSSDGQRVYDGSATDAQGIRGAVAKSVGGGSFDTGGSGFFVSPTSAIGQRRRAAEVAWGGSYANGQVRTIGRDLADVFFEPGTQEFGVLSGFGDAAVAIGADMVVTNPIQDAAAAAKVFRTAEGATTATSAGGRAVENVMGLIRGGTRPTYNRQLVEAYADSGPGLAAWERLAAETSISKIDALTGRSLDPELLVAIRDTTDPAAMRALAVDNLGVGWRTAPPGPMSTRVKDLGFTVKDRLPGGVSRLGEKMPTLASVIDMEDGRGVVTQAERMLSNTKADQATIDRYMEELARATSVSERRGPWIDMIGDIGKRLAAEQGVDPKMARQMTELYDGLKSDTLYWIDDLGNNSPSNPMRVISNGQLVEGPTPHLSSEMLKRWMPQPDVRALRAEFSNPVTRWISRNSAGDQRSMWTVALGFQDRVWKPAALLRGAWPIRVLGEEQARVAAVGLSSLVNNPLGYMAFLIGDSPRVGRMLERWGIDGRGATDIFGGLMKESDEFAGAMMRGHGGFTDERVLSHYGKFEKGEKGYVEAWADEIRTLAGAPEGQVVARFFNGPVTPEAIDTAEAVADAAPAARAAAEPFSDDIGPLFHGTSREFEEGPLRSGTGRISENLFGPGFYATDSEDVAASYMRKGKRGGTTPARYSLHWTGDAPPRILNLEEAAPEGVADLFRRQVDAFRESTYMEIDNSVLDEVIDALDNGTISEAYSAMRKALRGQRRSDVDEILGDLNSMIADLGYDAFRYQGGVRTGSETLHTAYVLLDDGAGSFGRYASRKVFSGADAATTGDVVAAPAGVRSNPLLAAQDYFWDNLEGLRKEMMANNPNAWADLTTRPGSDQFIATVQTRLTQKTRNMTELVDAVATGRINGVQLFEPGTPFISKAAVKELEGFAGAGPDIVRGPRRVNVGAGAQSWAKPLDRGVEWGFEHLMTKPANYLSRSSVFRQTYVDEVIGLASRVDASDLPGLLRYADEAGLSGADIKRLKTVVGSQAGADPMPLEALDQLAKGHALFDTKALLYDLAEKGQFFDVFRLIFPFGEAWTEMVTTWAGIVKTRPKVALTVKRIIEGGRNPTVGAMVGAPEGKGAFYRDEFGEERFAYPGSGQMLGLLGLPEVPLTGRLAGLSLMSEVLPGVGPIVQLPAAVVIPDKPAYDWLRSIAFPFGAPDKVTPLGAVEEMMPAWARTIFRGATGGDITSEGQRAYGNTTMDVVRYLASTGDYQISGSPNSGAELTRLLNDANGKSMALTVIRGLAQNVAPSSPTYEWYIDAPDGRKLSMLTLVAEYREMQEDDFETATPKFLDKYGDNAFLLMQGKSVSVSSGILPPTTAANDWLRDNMGLRGAFPSTYGFFAPQGGEFSAAAYQRQLELQERSPLTPEQFVRSGNDMVAQSIYYTERDAMMAEAVAGGRKSLTADQQTYMRDLDEWLRTNYEGYGDEAGKLGRAEPEEMIDELSRAIDDPALRDTPMAAGIRDYLAERAWVRTDSKANLDSVNSYQSAAGGTVYRQHLEAFAESIIEDNPDFAIAWERVFRPEIRAGIEKDAEGEE